MTVLKDDIAAFDRMKADLEAHHDHEWVVFYQGKFVGAFPDFETAAAEAVDRFDTGPYLIRQVGAQPVQLPGGMIFTPAHVLGPSGGLRRGRTARLQPTFSLSLVPRYWWISA